MGVENTPTEGTTAPSAPIATPATADPNATGQPGAAPPAEGGPPTAPAQAAPPVVDEAKAKEFARLARAEKIIREREAKAAKLQAEIDARAKSFAEREELAKRDPFAFLAASGLTYEQLTELAIKQKPQATSAEAKRIAELEQWKADQEAKARADQEAAQKAAEARIVAAEERYREGLRDLAKSDAYRAVHVVGDDAIDVAWHVVVEHFNATGEALSREAALQKVEDHYRTIISKGAAALGLVAPPKATEGQPAAPKASEPKSPIQTLTNGLSQQATPTPATPPAYSAERLRESARRAMGLAS